jgi:parallel beta-helix repeat protein
VNTRLPIRMGLIIIGFLVLFVHGTKAAATFYVSPNGSGTACTFSSPCALSRLQSAAAAGDTWILTNGVYRPIRLDNLHGNKSQPITIRADNERQAHVKGPGGSYEVFTVSNSSWLIIDGIRVSDTISLNPQASPVFIRNSNNLVLKRMLIHQVDWGINCNLATYANCANIAAVQTVGSDNLIFEENELYNFHRHGFSLNQSPRYGGGAGGHVLRRNYCNARQANGGVSRGNCIVAYPSSNNVIENNISEETATAYDIEADYAADANGASNNLFLGNMSHGGGGLFRESCRSFRPTSTFLKDNVGVNGTSVGIYLRGSKNAQLENNTIIGAANTGIAVDDQRCQSYLGESTSFTEVNSLVLDSGMGFSISNVGVNPWSVRNSNSYGNSMNYYPISSVSNYSNPLSQDPQIGQCKLWIPDNSTMKGAGMGGADIGANVLYAYESGALTNKPLWDRNTGEFLYAGAIVLGVNDVQGRSLFDIQQRLNIGAANGCHFPRDYLNGNSASPTAIR